MNQFFWMKNKKKKFRIILKKNKVNVENYYSLSEKVIEIIERKKPFFSLIMSFDFLKNVKLIQIFWPN